MNIKAAIAWGQEELKNLENPKLEAEVLLSEVLKCDRSFLKTHPENTFPVWKKLLYKKCVQERRKNIPTAYVLGYKKWANIFLHVNQHVLIPRDETEILCEHISKTKRSHIPQTALDVGTGSGNIAIYLARNFTNLDVTALDISHKALKVAKRNAKENHVDIRFLHSNFLSAIGEGSSWDLIVANLPYVPSTVSVTQEVSREPQEAIFSGEDGLEALRKFANQLKEKNIAYKELWLEFFPSQSEVITKLFAPRTVKFYEDGGGTVFFAKVT